MIRVLVYLGVALLLWGTLGLIDLRQRQIEARVTQMISLGLCPYRMDLGLWLYCPEARR